MGDTQARKLPPSPRVRLHPAWREPPAHNKVVPEHTSNCLVVATGVIAHGWSGRAQGAGLPLLSQNSRDNPTAIPVYGSIHRSGSWLKDREDMIKVEIYSFSAAPSAWGLPSGCPEGLGRGKYLQAREKVAKVDTHDRPASTEKPGDVACVGEGQMQPPPPKKTNLQ